MNDIEKKINSQSDPVTPSFKSWRRGLFRFFDKFVAKKFHRSFYRSQAYIDEWMGLTCVQNPFDLWIKQQIIWETRPEVIIETGTFRGGSALFYATLLEAIGHGKVITIDVAPDLKEASQHPLFMKRVIPITGSSLAPETVQEVAKGVGYANAMLILDSDHTKEHVLKELQIYNHFVAPGNYAIVDKTHLNGHPIRRNHGPGPYEAVQAFVKEHKEFEIDHKREKYLFTFSPSGYLRRKPQ